MVPSSTASIIVIVGFFFGVMGKVENGSVSILWRIRQYINKQQTDKMLPNMRYISLQNNSK